MPSTYTVNLGIEKPATGEQSGTWGDTTNVNFDIIDQAVNGSERVTLTSAGTSGSPNDLNIVNGSTTSSEGRNKWIEIYSASDLGGSAYVRLVPNDAEKILFIRNSLAGSQSVLLFQGTYNASNDLEIPAGVDMVVRFDGAGASATVTDVFTKLRAAEITTPTLTAGTADINGGSVDGATVGAASASTGAFTTLTASTSLNIAASTTVDGILDEDNMASDSATKLATQQSIKAYVDSQVGTVDTLAEILANGNTSGANNLIIDNGQAITTNTINETTAASGVTIDSVLLKDDGVNATNLEITNLKANDGTSAGSIADSTGIVTLASSVLTTADINGGTIDGTTLGATTPSSVAATTGSFSSTLGVTGAATFSSTVAGAFNGTLGATTPASVAATTGTFSGAITAGAFSEFTGGLSVVATDGIYLDGGGDTYFQEVSSNIVRLMAANQEVVRWNGNTLETTFAGNVSTAALTATTGTFSGLLTAGTANSQNSVFGTIIGSGGANEGAVIVSSATGKGWLGFNNGNNASIPGQVTYDHATNVLSLYSSGTVSVTGAATFSGGLTTGTGLAAASSNAANIVLTPNASSVSDIYTSSGPMRFLTPGGASIGMVLDASGNLLVGQSVNNTGKINTVTAPSTYSFAILNTAGTVFYNGFYESAAGLTASWNGANTALYLSKDTTSSRSINAAGTLNASGADYAEYEQNNGLTISKGSVVGFKADGTLTLTFSDAIRFAIKSTNPSYVGGDTWGTEEQVGIRPFKPADDADDEVVAKYEADLATFETALEAARQLVDRIAYSGKVPVNVQGATAGDYIIAVAAEDGSIGGQAVSDPDFAQYKLAVGRVNRILDDGRAEIAVIIH
jgi:hypothetical protein